MQQAQLGRLPVGRFRRNGEPLGREGEVNGLFQIELGVFAQSGGVIGGVIVITQDGEFATVQGGRALAGGVGDTHLELRRIIVKDDQNQGRARFWPRVDVIGKVAPDDFAGGGFFPPPCHEFSGSSRLERTECLVP